MLDKDISLADFKGQTIVLVFYPLDFSPLCSIQLPEYSSRKTAFEKHNAVVICIALSRINISALSLLDS
jgi:peroxiredoxin